MRGMIVPGPEGPTGQNLFALELRAAANRASQTPTERARLVAASSARRLAAVVRRVRPVSATRHVTGRRLRGGARRRVARTDDDGGGEPAPPPPQPARSPAARSLRSTFLLPVHPASTSGRATAHGVDTVRYAFRDPALVAALRPLPKVHPVTGERLRWQPQSHGWHVRLTAGPSVISYPGHLAVEWRLAPLLTGDERDRRLIDPCALERGGVAAGAVLTELTGGVRPTGPIGIARCDLAAELCFDDSTHGLVWLRALAQVSLPRLERVERTDASGRLRSVAWERPSGGKVLGAYDAGVVHQTHGAGRRLRLERQHIARKSSQQTPEQFNASDATRVFLGFDLERTISAARPLVVAAPSEASAAVERLAVADVTRRRLLGDLHLLENGGCDANATRRLRDHGIVVQGQPQEAALDVAPGVRALAARWTASSEGRAA